MMEVENTIKDILIEEIENLNDSDLARLWSGIVINGEYYKLPLIMSMEQFRKSPEARRVLGINSLMELADRIGDFVDFNGFDAYVIVKPTDEITSASNVTEYINIEAMPEMNPIEVNDDSMIGDIIDECIFIGGILGGYELDSRGHVTDDSTEGWYIIDEDALREAIQNRFKIYFAW